MTNSKCSDGEAVKATASQLLQLVFGAGGFDEMFDGTAFGIMAKAAKPVIYGRAVKSIEDLSEERASWLIDQVHQLSAHFEKVTGNLSNHHFDIEGED